MPVLRMMAMGVKVGRAIRVGVVLHAERMGNKVIHTPYQKVIRQILLQANALFPAVIAKISHMQSPCFRGSMAASDAPSRPSTK